VGYFENLLKRNYTFEKNTYFSYRIRHFRWTRGQPISPVPVSSKIQQNTQIQTIVWHKGFLNSEDFNKAKELQANMSTCSGFKSVNVSELCSQWEVFKKRLIRLDNRSRIRWEGSYRKIKLSHPLFISHAFRLAWYLPHHRGWSELFFQGLLDC